MTKKKGYKDAPWTFKGRALYQLSLVKLEEARRYIPDELHIVNFFGYTLGGFYLARYDDSPVGAFDECVALAGIVWNKPTSCGWAARVYVTDREARDHGRQHVGLPSRMCTLNKIHPGEHTTRPSWWDQPRTETAPDVQDSISALGTDAVCLEEPAPPAGWKIWRNLSRGSQSGPICTFSGFPSGVGKKGPRVRLKLPSFSGLTPEQPDMLHYTCHIDCRLRAIKPLQVGSKGTNITLENGMDDQDGVADSLVEVIGRRPVMAIAFDDMEMTVQEPQLIPPKLGAQSRWDLQSGSPSLVAS